MGIGFAIPMSTARFVMDGLIEKGQVTRGWIGVEPRDLNPEMAESLAMDLHDGVLIAQVIADGPAEAGGLRSGDVVHSVGGTPVHNTAQLLNAVAALKPGSRAALGVVRDNARIGVDVTVGKRPSSRVARSRAD